MDKTRAKIRVVIALFGAWLLTVGSTKPEGLPEPSGPYRVGTSTYFVIDSEREPPTGDPHGRSLSVQAWYPSETEARGIRAPYLFNWEVLEELVDKGYFDQSSDLLTGWRDLITHSAMNIPPIQSEIGLPLVLFSPGLGVMRANYTTLAENLASHGYVVGVIDHPFGAFTRNGEGRVLRLAEDANFKDDEETSRRYEEQWAADIRFVLDWLAGPRPRIGDAIDFSRVAVVGHSLGGGAAFEACRADDRFSACVNLDGFSFGAAREDGVDAPAMLVKAVPDYSDGDLAKRGRTREEWTAMGQRVRPQLVAPLVQNKGGVSYFTEINGTGHLSFSDAPFVMPDTISRFGGTILAPERTLHILTTVVRAFLAEHLLGRDGQLLDVRGQFPEVEIEVIVEGKDP